MHSADHRILLAHLAFFALSLVIVIPVSAQLSPSIVNTGGSCGMPFVDPSLVWSHCTTVHYDFDACAGNGGDLSFQQVSGPGSIDASTGIWTWDSVPVTAAGQTYSVVVRPIETGNGTGPSVTLTVSIQSDQGPTLTSGCALSNILAGQQINTQMQFTQVDCDPITWQATLLVGDTGTQISIDQNGLAGFSAKVPGLYGVRIIISDGLLTDTCDHGYIVNGGPGCCVGLRGNINNRGGVDLSDLALLIVYLNVPATPLPCVDGANLNGTGIIDIADLARLVSFLTTGQPSLMPCP